MNLLHLKDLSSAHLPCSENDAIPRSAIYPLNNVNTILLDRQASYVYEAFELINVHINQSAVCCLLHPQGSRIIVLHILVFINKEPVRVD